MAQYSAEVVWERGDAVFTDNRYSRRHRWRFDGGLEVAGSSSPNSVPVPICRMPPPWTRKKPSLPPYRRLSHAVVSGDRRQTQVSRSTAITTGPLRFWKKMPRGRWYVSVVTLHPEVQFSGELLPTAPQIEDMHHAAHAECYIANSVSSQVRIEPVLPAALARMEQPAPDSQSAGYASDRERTAAQSRIRMGAGDEKRTICRFGCPCGDDSGGGCGARR